MKTPKQSIQLQSTSKSQKFNIFNFRSRIANSLSAKHKFIWGGGGGGNKKLDSFLNNNNNKIQISY